MSENYESSKPKKLSLSDMYVQYEGKEPIKVEGIKNLLDLINESEGRIEVKVKIKVK